MVSGLQKNKAPQKKGKQKLVLAKDPKQLAIALVVILLFIGNTIYMVAKYVMEQNPPQVTNSANSARSVEKMMSDKGGGAPGQPDSASTSAQNQAQPSTENASGANSTAQPMTTPAAPPVPSGINPAVPIAIVVILLLLLLAYVISQRKKENDSNSKTNKKTGKQKKDSGKFVLAKDPKQLALAAVIAILFIGNTIFMIFKYVQSQNPQPMTAQNPATMTPEERMAQQQQKNLESLNNGESPSGANPDISQDANNIYSQTMGLKGDEHAVTNEGKRLAKDAESDIEILPKRMVRDASGKMVLISVDNSGRSNPFLPAAENFVPSATSSMPFLPPPPETLQTNSDAGKVMTTVISGILYDKYSPSAIINIEGVDYLVKRGDVVNRYKILSIGKAQVLVQLGKNVYQAGVGELLSLTNMNFNTIANLNKKFGGNDVSINVRKKSY